MVVHSKTIWEIRVYVPGQPVQYFYAEDTGTEGLANNVRHPVFEKPDGQGRIIATTREGTVLFLNVPCVANQIPVPSWWELEPPALPGRLDVSGYVPPIPPPPPPNRDGR